MQEKERFIRDSLAALDRAHRAAAEPLWKMLAEIEACKPPRYLVLPGTLFHPSLTDQLTP